MNSCKCMGECWSGGAYIHTPQKAPLLFLSLVLEPRTATPLVLQWLTDVPPLLEAINAIQQQPGQEIMSNYYSLHILIGISFSSHLYSLHFALFQNFSLLLQLLLTAVKFFLFPLSGSTEVYLEELPACRISTREFKEYLSACCLILLSHNISEGNIVPFYCILYCVCHWML